MNFSLGDKVRLNLKGKRHCCHNAQLYPGDEAILDYCRMIIDRYGNDGAIVIKIVG
jgi:hypothetical protein